MFRVPPKSVLGVDRTCLCYDQRTLLYAICLSIKDAMDQMFVHLNHAVQGSMGLDVLSTVVSHQFGGFLVPQQVFDAIGDRLNIAWFHGESIPLIVDGFGDGAHSSTDDRDTAR